MANGTVHEHHCCPAEDPCPRHLGPTAHIRSGGLERARRADGVDDGALREAAAGGLSRRALLRGAAGAGLFVAAAPAVAAQPVAQGAPVFPDQHGRIHTLPSTAETVRVGAMDPTAPPGVTIDSGDIVHYPNTWVNWADEAKYGMSFADREPIRKKYPQGPYSLVGPVVVRGAEPGDVVECRMLRLKPIDWGWNSAPKGVGALPADFSEPYLHYLRFDPERKHSQFAEGVRIPLAPLQGVMAAQPAGDKPVSAILSGRYGGNILLRDLVEGTSLFLPVEVPGARLWTGDSHAAQGDGVVDQTAIETAMEDLRIQYVLHKGVAIAGPVAETPTHWITLGFGDDLEAALTASLRQTITWVAEASGLPKLDIYALASVVGSFRITQYAHQTGTVYANVPPKAVHGMIPKTVFDPAMQARIGQALRPEA
jgi:acetamidase/formamidase